MGFPDRRARLLPGLFCTLLLAACGPLSAPPDDAVEAPAAAAKPAALPAPTTPAAEPMPAVPELRIATLDGSQYDLQTHRGRWVVVNFWATWCAPCLKEMPELSALDAMREHIEVIGLAYEDIEPAAMREFLVRHPVVYPIAIVNTYDPPKAFDTPRGLPMTYLIAPDGRVVETFLGPVTAEEIEKAIAAAGGPAPVA
ncbi:MAG: TlpA family protein disulfide reductase [Pseudomonadota bacterium]|nr:TlpA family protein disulfide reductase [Pseudomonadota bacterium]